MTAAHRNLDRTGQVPWNKGTKGAQQAWNKGRVSLVEAHRECLQCRGWLPFDAFAVSKTKAGGVASTCRVCVAANRAQREDQLWRDAVKLLGGACQGGCGIKIRSVLHLRPLTEWAAKYRGAGKDRRSSTLAKLLLAMGEEQARTHVALECANCDIRRRHGKTRCPR